MPAGVFPAGISEKLINGELESGAVTLFVQ